MATYDFDIGILGGGAAGLTVASGAAQAGAKVLLVEKEKRLGGDCLHYGCVPSKTLIRTAQVYHLMRIAREFGLPEVVLPNPDYREVAKRIESVIATIQKHDSEERFCGQCRSGPRWRGRLPPAPSSRQRLNLASDPCRGPSPS